MAYNSFKKFVFFNKKEAFAARETLRRGESPLKKRVGRL